jgi:pyruvate/2-oxoglutarate dehydrogenase complex dihydrolipoamide dehydrogenase (E3) component
VLPREDPEIAAALLTILREDGITVHLSSTATSVSFSPDGIISLAFRDSGGTEHTLTGSHLLVASGRTPNTEMLNLGAADIKMTSRGHIVANERLETGTPGVYALGDVKGPPAFTHISYDDFRIVQANVLEGVVPPLTITNRLVPSVTYTDPQLGNIGLREKEAREKFPGRKIMTAKMPMSYVARALETAEPRGLMKAVVDGETGEILGFSCLGLEGGEVMSLVQTAMMGKVGWKTLRDAVWAHPALAESLNNLWGYLE